MRELILVLVVIVGLTMSARRSHDGSTGHDRRHSVRLLHDNRFISATV